MDRFAVDWRSAALDPMTAALLGYTERLTAAPSDCGQADIDALRAIGWNDRAISDAIQVCAYFNYINRIADGHGIDPEDWIDETGRRL